MVKGVNKTIIEVNNTGSKFFEKIVFYVSPEYGNLNAKQLRRAATSFSFNYTSLNPPKNELRKRIKRKRIKKMLICFSLILAVFLLIVFLICK